jgi:hypothetical protein
MKSFFSRSKSHGRGSNSQSNISTQTKQAQDMRLVPTQMNLTMPRSISPGRKRPYPNHLRRKTTAVYSDRLRQSYTTFYGILRLS